MKLIPIVKAILSQYAGTRVNGKVASDRTIDARGESICGSFRTLLQLGYKLENPHNIGERHIKALCIHWYESGRTPKTIQGYLSNLRIFCGWIGKQGLVKNAHYYLPEVPKDKLQVKATASMSKSWTESGINVADKIELASQLDWRFGLMLMAQVAFGLRRMEVLQMHPWKCDEGKTFFAYKTKGGRPRLIYIDTEVQRAVMDLIKSKIRKSEYLGWSERTDGGKATLAYAENRYNYLMAKIGITKALAEVTGHGLRAQFAENAALLKNLIPPTLGGTPGQMPREDLDLKRLQVSESLGHSRISVTGAYYGSFGREVPVDPVDRVKEKITACTDTLKIDPRIEIAEERRVDCAGLMMELAMIQVYVEPRKIQVLWEHHSRRHATNWLKPNDGTNLAALEAAAISIVRSSKSSPNGTLA